MIRVWDVAISMKTSVSTAASRCLSVLTLLGVGACESDPTVPAVDLVTVSIELSAPAVSPGDTLLVTLVLDNPTDEDVVFSSPTGCLAFPSVHKDGASLGWDGTNPGCLAAPGRYPVPAHGRLVREYDIRVPSDQNEYPYLVAPAPGTYQMRLDLQVALPDQRVDFLVTPCANPTSSGCR